MFIAKAIDQTTKVQHELTAEQLWVRYFCNEKFLARQHFKHLSTNPAFLGVLGNEQLWRAVDIPLYEAALAPYLAQQVEKVWELFERQPLPKSPVKENRYNFKLDFNFLQCECLHGKQQPQTHMVVQQSTPANDIFPATNFWFCFDCKYQTSNIHEASWHQLATVSWEQVINEHSWKICQYHVTPRYYCTNPKCFFTTYVVEEAHQHANEAWAYHYIKNDMGVWVALDETGAELTRHKQLSAAVLAISSYTKHLASKS